MIVVAGVIETAIAVVVVATEIVMSARPVAEIAVAIETVIEGKDDRSRTPSPPHRTSAATSGRTTVNVVDARTVAATSRVAKTVVVVIVTSAVRATPSAPLRPQPLKTPHTLKAQRQLRRKAVARRRARTPLRALQPRMALNRTVKAAYVADVAVVVVVDAAACEICLPVP